MRRTARSEKDGNLKKYSIRRGIVAYFFEAFDLETFEKLLSIKRNAIKTYYKRFMTYLKLQEDKVVQSALASGYPLMNHIQYYQALYDERV